jgi:hypothetical protein
MLGYNPYAPPIYHGLGDASPAGYEDRNFDYVYDTPGTGLTALQALQDQLTLNNDAAFVWMAVYISKNIGAFTVRFSDSRQFYLSSAPISNLNLPGDSSSPYPIDPPMVIPPGGRIGIDLTDLSNAPNVIEIVFRGFKRFKLLPGQSISVPQQA